MACSMACSPERWRLETETCCSYFGPRVELMDFALFEAFRLTILYDRARHQDLVQATLTDDTVDRLGTKVVPVFARGSRSLEATRAATSRHGSAWHPQRDSNPCYRLERAAS